MQPVYLFSGESFLAGEALARVRDELGDLSAEVAFDAAAPGHEIVGALQTASLLGGMRLVVVRDAQDLDKDAVAAIDAYLASPAEHSVLVLQSSGKTKLDATVRQMGGFVALDPPKGRRLVGWLRVQAGEHGVTLDEKAAWALIDAVGNELRDLDTALEQLATAADGGKIGAADVTRLFLRQADERVYAFTDGIGDRRLGPAMAALERLLRQGESPLMIFGALAGQVRRMLRARSFIDGGVRAVESGMGLPGWRAERLLKQARSYREDELVAAIQILAEADLAIKSGGNDSVSGAILETAVVRIVG